MKDDKRLLPARKVRSPFGTRVARRIVCSACGASDTIHFSPRQDQQPLCRQCAAEHLGVVDREARIGPDNRVRCDQCGLFVHRPCEDEPLDCSEYARALAMRQDDRSRRAERTKNGTLRVRRAK